MVEIENKKEVLYQLDVLRAIAIIGVFLVHCQYAVFPGFDFTYSSIIADIPRDKEKYKIMALFPFAFGWMGVMLFFLISGFLIHFVTLNTGKENLNYKLYFNKRFWRIYPPYLLALFFFYFSKRSIADFLNEPFDLLSHIFLIHNYSEKYFFSINGVFWSLAVEAQLYLLYPVFLFLCIKSNIRTVMWVLVIIAILSTFYWWYTSNFKSIAVGNSVLKHWLVWGLGAFMAEAYYKKKRLFNRVSMWLWILLALIFYFSKIFTFHFITDHYASAILMAILMEKYLYNKNEITSLEKMMIPIGLCSYSIYLFHLPFLSSLFYSIDIFKISNHSKLLFLIVNSVPIFLIIYFFSISCYKLIETKSIETGNNIYNKKTL